MGLVWDVFGHLTGLISLKVGRRAVATQVFGTPIATVDLFSDGGVNNTSFHQQFRRQNIVIFPRVFRFPCLSGV